MATSAAGQFQQDLPPKGGYKKLNFARIPARQVLNGPIIFGSLFGTMAVGAYFYVRGMRIFSIQKIERRSGALALEPMMLAERDREYLKQIRKNRDDEAKLMKDVEGWEVGTWYGHPVYRTIGDKWVDPKFQEYNIHCSRNDMLHGNNMEKWLKID